MRHPDVLSRTKSVDEAQFEFYNLFTSMHSANKYFTDEKVVSQEDFNEYHSFVSAQIERDCEFRNFIIGVWNMDVKENLEQSTRTNYNDECIAGKKSVAFPAKNSHE